MNIDEVIAIFLKLAELSESDVALQMKSKKFANKMQKMI